MNAPTSQDAHLLGIPGELRNIIAKLVFKGPDDIRKPFMAITLTCRQLHDEWQMIAWQVATFKVTAAVYMLEEALPRLSHRQRSSIHSLHHISLEHWARTAPILRSFGVNPTTETVCLDYEPFWYRWQLRRGVAEALFYNEQLNKVILSQNELPVNRRWLEGQVCNLIRSVDADVDRLANEKARIKNAPSDGAVKFTGWNQRDGMAAGERIEISREGHCLIWDRRVAARDGSGLKDETTNDGESEEESEEEEDA